MNKTGISGRVLLVDDQEWNTTPLVGALGPVVDWCPSVTQLAERIEHGETWSAAFVDFNLGPNQPSGLNAMRILRGVSPNIRLVSLTGLTESGRMLFMAAAAHWYGAVLLNKEDLPPAQVRQAADPASNPTAPLLQRRLRKAHLVDDLFAQPSWLRIWRAWPRFNGSQPAIVRTTGLGSGVVRRFGEQATAAVNEFERAFGGTERQPPPDAPPARIPPRKDHGGGNRKLATPLTRFALENRLVFFAPGIDLVLNDLHVRQGQAERPTTRRGR